MRGGLARLASPCHVSINQTSQKCHVSHSSSVSGQSESIQGITKDIHNTLLAAQTPINHSWPGSPPTTLLHLQCVQPIHTCTPKEYDSRNAAAGPSSAGAPPRDIPPSPHDNLRQSKQPGRHAQPDPTLGDLTFGGVWKVVIESSMTRFLSIMSRSIPSIWRMWTLAFCSYAKKKSAGLLHDTKRRFSKGQSHQS